MIELIELPFDILTAAEGDAKVGYAFLMILFSVGFIVLSVYILDFFKNIYEVTMNLFRRSIESVTSIKRSPSIASVASVASKPDPGIKALLSKVNSLHDKIDNLKS